MPSLSSYDKGKKSFEGRRYRADVESAVEAMWLLTEPFKKLQDYNPRMILVLGNHENRVERAIEDDPKLDGTIGLHDLRYEEFGWEVFPFLEIARVDGISYSHYFTTGVMGRPAGSAAVMLRECMGSAIAGHVQKFDFAVHPKTGHCAIMVGVCYLHDEPYLGAQGNNCRRQIVMLHEVKDGRFDVMTVSLDYLRRKYADS